MHRRACQERPWQGPAAEAQQGGTRSDSFVPSFLASHCWREKGTVTPQKPGGLVQSLGHSLLISSQPWCWRWWPVQRGLLAVWSHLCPLLTVAAGLLPLGDPHHPPPPPRPTPPPPLAHPRCRPAAPTQQEALPLGDPGFEK